MIYSFSSLFHSFAIFLNVFWFCLSHCTLISEKLARGKKTSRGRKTTSLGNKQLFSLGWCRAVMNSTTSLSLIRPRLVSLWNAPTPPPPWGPQRGLRLPTPHHHLPVLLHFRPPPPDGYHPHPAAPLVTMLFSVEFPKKRTLQWSRRVVGYKIKMRP